MERVDVEGTGWGRRALCTLAALLMLATYGLTAVTDTAGAATPLPAPTNLEPSGGNAGPNPVLTWSPVTGAKYYRVTHPDQNGNNRTDTVYATSYATTVDYPLGTVSWSVTAYDQANQPGAAADASFVNSASDGPTLQCPSSPVNFPMESPAFSWAPVAGAKTYTLEVSTTDTFVPASTETYRTQSTSYTLTAGVPDDQVYYARVSATTYNNINTAASGRCSYKVVWSPGQTGDNNAKPTLTSPADGSHVRDVVLRWQALVGAASYEVQVSPNGDWTNNLYYDIITDSTTWSPAKTLNNGSYFWRVRGIDNAGNFSRWSDYPSTAAGDAWEFAVDPLATPQPVSPAAEVTIGNPDLRFSWKPVPGAGAYELQWSDNSSFSYGNQGDEINHTCLTTHTDWSPYVYENPPGQSSGPGGTGACRANTRDQSPGFVDGTTVYWRVRAIDDYTQFELVTPWNTNDFDTTNHRPSSNRAFVSNWSTPRRFFFNSAVPTVTGPAQGATVATPTMSWTRVPGAQYYLVTYSAKEWNWDNDQKKCIQSGGSAGSRTARTSALSYTPSLMPTPRRPDSDRDTDDDWDQCPMDVSFSVQAVDWSDRASPLPLQRSFTWRGYATTGLSATLDLKPTKVDPANGQIVNPAAGATIQGIPRFEWNPVAGADHYQVWWYDNPNGDVFTTMQDYSIGGSQRDPLTESFTPVQPLRAETGAWQVVAIDAGGHAFASSPKRTVTVAKPDPVQIEGFVTRVQPGKGDSCEIHGVEEPDCIHYVGGAQIPSTPLITWETNPSASYYRVIIAQDPNFTNVVRIYDTGQNSIRPVEALPDNQAGQSYYVFVQPAIANWWTGENATSTVFGDNATVEPSFVWSFSKKSDPVGGLSVRGPGGAPVPCDGNDPSNGLCISDVPTFSWNGANPYASGAYGDVAAMSYHIQVSTTQDFSNIIDEAWVDQPSYAPYEWPKRSNGGYSPGSTGAPAWRPNHKTYPDGPIYWRVQAVDATNNGLTYSATQSIQKKSTAVTLTEPGNTGSVGGTPSLNWQPKTFAARYQVQVARNGDTNFSSPNLAFDQFTDLTSITPTNNNRAENGTSLPAGTYAWRVRGVDADNNSGAWSTTWTFKVDPAAPSLLSPVDGRSFAELAGMAFTWSAVEGAVRYRVWVSKNHPPTSGGFSVDTVSTAWSLDRSLSNGTYYWMVQTLDAQNQVLATSAVRSFRLLGTRPTVTNLRASSSSFKTINLTWGSSNDPAVGPITGFTINRYDTSSATTPSATRSVGGSTSSYSWSGLDGDTRYYFTVTARDQYGPGPESNRVNAVAPGYTNVQSFVIAAYNDFLGRNPTTAQLNAAVATLGGINANPTATRKAAWLKALANSPAWVDAIVNQFYLDTLGRVGEPGGVSYWSGQISSGQKTVAEVASNFYASKEYFDGYGHSDLTTWVTDLYSKILNRTPDSGVAYWVSAVGAHANPSAFAGRVWVAYNFYQSIESRRKRVTDLYDKLLHRVPDDGGLAYWAGQILTDGDIALAVNLASSDEYYSRAHTRYPD